MNDKETIVKALVDTGKWSESAARRGFRADFRCAYCDRDLLASVNDYKSWQEDHIIPLSVDGKDEEENIVISCRTCNVNVKARWNPLTVCGENPSREELIEAVRKYVANKRTQFLEDVTELRKIVYTKL